VERIVLYIDDLDRCPPKRVVDVLEAVHLILALPLFVVVVAVDPRWLLQSLRLHYSELLASGAASAPPLAGSGGAWRDSDSWRSTPGHYLEKIIQVPFTLRPLTNSGVARLIGSLLPEPPVTVTATATMPVETVPTETTTSSAAPVEPEPVLPDAPAPPSPPVARAQALDLSPATLYSTEPERAFAALVARQLETPRAVKKFTNLYRLMRARLDEDSGELDRFLSVEGDNVPEYEAVLLLLGLIVAFPDDAAPFLLALGDLSPEAEADNQPWRAFVEALRRHRSDPWPALARFVAKVELTNANSSTREPFRRWALEVSRYSFTTGQEVFAKFGAAKAPRPMPSRASSARPGNGGA
jgi:hypothetical protein